MAYNVSEGAPHNPEDVGRYGLGVRRDSDTSPVADGEYHSNLYDDSGNLKVNLKAGSLGSPSGASSVGTGRVVNVSAGTAVQFPSNSCGRVLVTAESNNSGAIWIGDSSVLGTVGSEQGFILFSSQTSNPLLVSNTNLLYIDAVTSGDGVTFYFEA